jgi:rhodanese-related sulfurtransferase
MGAPFSVASGLLFRDLLDPLPPTLLDVRRPDILAQSGRIMPQARIADPGGGPALAGVLDPGRAVIVACAHGHNRSQRLAAFLRSEGFAASILEGGYDGWAAAGLPLVKQQARKVTLGVAPTVWVARRQHGIDRMACAWLVRRFLDQTARFLFVEEEWALEMAAQENAACLDIAGATCGHEGDLCSFEVLTREFDLAVYPPLSRLALIIRAADKKSLDLAPEAAGLLAISAGLTARHPDAGHTLLAEGFALFDALLSWTMEVVAGTGAAPKPPGKLSDER